MAAQIALKREDDDEPPRSQFGDDVWAEPACVVHRSSQSSSESLSTIMCPATVQVDTNNNNTTPDKLGITAEAKAKHATLSGEKIKQFLKKIQLTWRLLSLWLMRYWIAWLLLDQFGMGTICKEIESDTY